MGIGIRMRRLWKMKAGVLACTLLAAIAAVWSLNKISLSPPDLTPRSLEMASASTQVVVDTPRSAILDLRQDTYSIDGLINRAVLLGNVIASPPVRESIERRADLPRDVLQVTPPLTPKQPRARVPEDTERRTSDILKSNDQYRLTIQANPSAPVLYIYAQAPTAGTAAELANSSVDELRTYLTDLAAFEDTPAKEQIRLVQLGRAEGAVVNEGVKWEVGVLAFILTFAVACATLILLGRVRQGWRLAALSERTAAG
jgi:hypothetical protein